MTDRRFPPPWSVEELDACFVVRDHGGQQFILKMSQAKIGGKITHQRRSAADCGEYRQAAGAFAQALIAVLSATRG
jgi:hypothetical protein